MNRLRVAELFAGVGGFRIGFEAANKALGHDYFKVVWSNQWEPSTKVQHASDIYVRRFGAEGHSNEDIGTVPAAAIPEVDIVVGGFPCQDYSVATTLHRSGGLAGKKGVLWWEIHRILRDTKNKPPFLMLENVDRLLKSPASQRGRDFAVMLASLSDLGYAVEWRVINAAEYGMPQRRRRVFILGYHQDSQVYQRAIMKQKRVKWLAESGVIAQAFPVLQGFQAPLHPFELEGDLVELTDQFNKESSRLSPFANTGLMVNRKVTTFPVEPDYSGPIAALQDFLVDESEVPEEFFIGEELSEWAYLKGAKTIERVNKTTGHKYQYSEGGMAFPDALDRPSRTIITGEGGRGPSRFKHVVETPSGRHRRLVPVELERLNMFPDNHTEGVTDTRRAFLMGNALVTGIVDSLGQSLVSRIAEVSEEPRQAIRNRIAVKPTKQPSPAPTAPTADSPSSQLSDSVPPIK